MIELDGSLGEGGGQILADEPGSFPVDAAAVPPAQCPGQAVQTRVAAATPDERPRRGDHRPGPAPRRFLAQHRSRFRAGGGNAGQVPLPHRHRRGNRFGPCIPSTCRWHLARRSPARSSFRAAHTSWPARATISSKPPGGHTWNGSACKSRCGWFGRASIRAAAESWRSICSRVPPCAGLRLDRTQAGDRRDGLQRRGRVAGANCPAASSPRGLPAGGGPVEGESPRGNLGRRSRHGAGPGARHGPRADPVLRPGSARQTGRARRR